MRHGENVVISGSSFAGEYPKTYTINYVVKKDDSLFVGPLLHQYISVF